MVSTLAKDIQFVNMYDVYHPTPSKSQQSTGKDAE
jgi:hypothetical protein